MTALRTCCSAATTTSVSSSAASLFMQLSCVRHHHGSAANYSTVSSPGPAFASAYPILDVLLPPPVPATARSFRRHLSSSSPGVGTGIGAGRKRGDVPRSGAPRPVIATTNPTGMRTRPTPTHSAAIAAAAAHQLLFPRHGAFFGTTAARRKTQAIHNPQRDEEGNEMVLEITPRAANRLSHLMAQDQNPDLALRIQVEPGGCHGFQYLMSVTTLPTLTPSSSTTTAPPPPPDADAVAAEVAPSTTTSDEPSETAGLREDDTVFAFVPDGGAEGEGQGQERAAPKIVLDGPSLELLKGSKVDYTMELIGSQFKIVDNPHATSSCGCGTSFDIKDLGL